MCVVVWGQCEKLEDCKKNCLNARQPSRHTNTTMSTHYDQKDRRRYINNLRKIANTKLLHVKDVISKKKEQNIKDARSRRCRDDECVSRLRKTANTRLCHVKGVIPKKKEEEEQKCYRDKFGGKQAFKFDLSCVPNSFAAFVSREGKPVSDKEESFVRMLLKWAPERGIAPQLVNAAGRNFGLQGCRFLNPTKEEGFNNAEIANKLKKELPIGSTTLIGQIISSNDGKKARHLQAISRLDDNWFATSDGFKFDMHEGGTPCMLRNEKGSDKCLYYPFAKNLFYNEFPGAKMMDRNWNYNI